MNRRDFSKLLGGILAAPAALLLPKVEAKEKFPRYFAPFKHDPLWATMFDNAPFLRADSAENIVAVSRSGLEGKVGVTLMMLEQHRRWKEITAAEAKALLEPEPLWSDDVTDNLRQHERNIARWGTVAKEPPESWKYWKSVGEMERDQQRKEFEQLYRLGVPLWVRDEYKRIMRRDTACNFAELETREGA